MNSKLIVIILFVFKLSICNGTSYYISINGNDNNNGTSISSPWKSLKKVSLFSLNPGFSPGSVIKFEADNFLKVIQIFLVLNC